MSIFGSSQPLTPGSQISPNFGVGSSSSSSGASRLFPFTEPMSLQDVTAQLGIVNREAQRQSTQVSTWSQRLEDIANRLSIVSDCVEGHAAVLRGVSDHGETNPGDLQNLGLRLHARLTEIETNQNEVNNIVPNLGSRVTSAERHAHSERTNQDPQIRRRFPFMEQGFAELDQRVPISPGPTDRGIAGVRRTVERPDNRTERHGRDIAQRRHLY